MIFPFSDFTTLSPDFLRLSTADLRDPVNHLPTSLPTFKPVPLDPIHPVSHKPDLIATTDILSYYSTWSAGDDENVLDVISCLDASYNSHGYDADHDSFSSGDMSYSSGHERYYIDISYFGGYDSYPGGDFSSSNSAIYESLCISCCGPCVNKSDRHHADDVMSSSGGTVSYGSSLASSDLSRYMCHSQSSSDQSDYLEIQGYRFENPLAMDTYHPQSGLHSDDSMTSSCYGYNDAIWDDADISPIPAEDEYVGRVVAMLSGVRVTSTPPDYTANANYSAAQNVSAFLLEEMSLCSTDTSESDVDLSKYIHSTKLSLRSAPSHSEVTTKSQFIADWVQHSNESLAASRMMNDRKLSALENLQTVMTTLSNAQALGKSEFNVSVSSTDTSMDIPVMSSSESTDDTCGPPVPLQTIPDPSLSQYRPKPKGFIENLHMASPVAASTPKKSQAPSEMSSRHHRRTRCGKWNCFTKNSSTDFNSSTWNPNCNLWLVKSIWVTAMTFRMQYSSI